MDLDNIELLYTKVNNETASKNDLKQFVSIANQDEIVNIIWNERKRFHKENLKLKKIINKYKVMKLSARVGRNKWKRII